MKRSFILKLVIIACLLLWQLQAAAQVNISIQILPPYPTKFTDYASKPHLMVIMLTNTSTVAQRIQLKGAITGDNGVEIRSRVGQKGTSPIELAAGETKSLNGSDIAKIIDYTKLDYTGITQNEFLTKGGLPEGRYQLCARAYNYDNNQPVSADEPLGCSNVFTISSLEPPMILSPMADQQIPSGPGQVFSIRWNTPASAPPGTKYRIRMVEMLGNRNPNDAIMTATQPYFFEKEVNSNIYVYNPADPQLTPGRKYALMVEAFDPFEAAVFRNQGRSEVIAFEYGLTEPVIAAAEEGEVEEPEKEAETLPKTPVIVKGTLKYRFPESPESGLFTLKNTRVYLEKVSAQPKHKFADMRDTDPVDGVVATTDQAGNFELKLGLSAQDTAAGTRYRLRIANPHYKAYEELLRIAPGDTIKLQQLIVDANSYQLNVNVAESFNGVKGKYVPGATIKIYRLKADKLNAELGIPFYEGNLLDSAKNWKETGAKVLIAAAVTPVAGAQNTGLDGTASSVNFKRLFRNLGQPGYHYLVSLEKGEQVLAQRSFDDLDKIRKGGSGMSWQQAGNEPAQEVVKDFAYNQQANTTELTLLKELTASPRSKVTGVLKYGFKYYSGIPNQPYANMKVSLRSSEDMKNVVTTAVTDVQGRFTFDFANVDSTYKARAVRQGGRTVGMDRRVYFVVPEVKYYAVPNTEVLVQPWGDYDCGELVSMVQTYALKINAEGENKEAVPQAEVLVLRYSPETFKDQLPNLPEMNTSQQVSFGNANALTNNYTVGNEGNGMVMTVNIAGEPGSRTNNFVLQRKVYTEADGSTVTIKGLIPSLNMDKDKYQIRVGSSDRSNSVAYETGIFDYPYMLPPRPQPGIDVIDKNQLTPEGRLKSLRDKHYDPTWGYKETVTFDPGGAMVTKGLNMGILQSSATGVVGAKVSGPQVKALGGAKIGYAANSGSGWFESSDWLSLAKSLSRYEAKVGTGAAADNNLFNRVGPLLSDTAIVFNSQLPAAEPVFEESVIVAKKGWRIAGRAIDAFSKLGVKNLTAFVCQSGMQFGKVVYYNFGHIKANENGDFVLTTDILYPNSTGFKADQNAALKLVAPGYEELIIDLGRITKGSQYYDEQINLKPLGTGLYGYVVDAEEKRLGVPARLKMVDNGKWVNTVAYTGDKYKESMNSGQNLDMSEQVRDMQRFSIDLPSAKVKLVVMPYDRAYLTDTIEVDLARGDQFVGMIPLTHRTHKVRVRVMHQKDQLVPALVTLVETGTQDTIMQSSGTIEQTTAFFNFVNNATKNFTIHVKPLSNTPIAGKKLFVPRTFTIENVDNGKEKTYELEVFPGRVLTGNVAFDTGEKVSGAKVYMESGWGAATDNFSVSDKEGKYSIVLPQLGLSEYTVRASYSEEGKTYVSAEKLIGPQENKADLTIKVINDIDISRLLGFKTKITALTPQGDGVYQVSGELSDIPVNGNFGTTDSILNRNLTFSKVLVKASAIKNSAGVPYAVPLEDIPTDNMELAVAVNNAFNGILLGGEGQIMLRKGRSDTSGTINGKVRILDNSFQFPSSYMRMQDTDFYLGIQTAAETMPVFSSAQKGSLADQFLLTNKQGKAIAFKYLGFNGVADIQGARTSNLKGETIRLYLNLSTLLPGNIPLTLKAGEARISKGGIGKIIASDTVSFKLENWTVKAARPAMAGMIQNMETGESTQIDNSTWILSPGSGGLVIKKGEILTGKLNIPFKDLTIIPNEEGFPGDLTCPDLIGKESLQNVDFNIGGIAKLKVRQGSQVSFIYDPGVGRDGSGHYKLSVTSPNYNDYAASFAGLDGMSNAAESFKIQMISLLSNGEELFSFVNNQSITYYNQVKFMPKMLSGTSQNSFSIAGSLDLGVPSLNTNFYETLVYSKNGNGNKVTMPVLDFSFTGQGGVKFTSVAKKEAQQFRSEGFVMAGNMSLPGGVNLKGGKLISMVTSAAGAALEREVDVLFGAREKVEQYFEDTKRQLEARVQQAKDDLLKAAETAVKDEVTKLIPMGTDEAKGALGEVAGAWKLGQGAADALADGDYMRLAGMMKNIPGVDEAIQDVKNAVVMEAKNQLNAVQENLPEFKDLPVGGNGFKEGNFEFDLKNGRIFGHIGFDFITLGAVTLRNGAMEMLFDRDGWYFCSGATMDIPVPILTPLKVGVLIGNYGTISDELEGRLVQIAQSQSKRLPPKVKSGLSGFFIVGGKPIADVDVGFGIPGIAQFKLVASAGAEVRTYALFGKGKFTMGMGALAYGRVYASASALGLSVAGGADINVAIATTAEFNNGAFALCAQGCVSVDIFVEACVFGACGSLQESVMAMLNLGVGDEGILRTTGCGKQGVDLSISLGKGTCINNPKFDF